MGRRTGMIVVPVSVSDHNGDRDRNDRALAEELRDRIKDILREEKFQDVAPLGVDLEI